MTVVSAEATVEIGRPRSGETKFSVPVLVITSPSGRSALIVASNVTVAEAPGASVPPSLELAPLPSLAVIVPPTLLALPLPAETVGPALSVTAPGIGSVSWTLVALAAPLLVAVIV
ncbi:unannotated protein [freshwater metagenome]|uniref:Unannotated protein n=1 Tax=freshwater metagenome TaxID=449393 RepID=A0A6J5ZZ49_9ZZZZ